MNKFRLSTILILGILFLSAPMISGQGSLRIALMNIPAHLNNVPDGLYAIQVETPGGWEYLHVAHNKTNGNVAVYWNQHAPNALWQLTRQPNGLYAIQAKTPGGWEYLHVAHNKTNGNVTVYWNQHGQNARWQIIRDQNGLYSIQAKTPGGWEYLHVAHNKTNGNVAVYWNQHGKNARWKLLRVSNHEEVRTRIRQDELKIQPIGTLILDLPSK